MALQFADGFDQYGGDVSKMLGEYANGGNQIGVLDNTVFRTGNYSLKLTQLSGMKWIVQAPTTALGMAAAYFHDNLPSSNLGPNTQIFNFSDNAGNEYVRGYLLPNGAIRFMRQGVFIGDTNPCITPNTWNHIETFVVLGGAGAGYIEMRVNNGTVFIANNVQTVSGNNTVGGNIAFASVYNGTFAGGAVNQWIDDFFVWDTSGAFAPGKTFMGDRRCLTLLPSSDVAPSQWTPSAGPNSYSIVGQLAPNDANYIATGNVGDKATFGLPDLPANANNVAGVILRGRFTKTDASDCAVKMALITGVVEVDTPDLHLTLGPQYRSQVIEINPGTGTRFTPAEINAAFLQLQRSI